MARWYVVVAAAMFAAPGVSWAQQPTAQAPGERRTHTVKRGDTLWDLARTYLNDPFLWPEIYRLNTELIKDPHWIYPGEILKLPGPAAAAVVAEQPAPAEDVSGPTVFSARQAQTTSGGTSQRAAAPAPTVRFGEYLRAPFVVERGGPRASGRILESADLPGIAQASDRSFFAAYDRILIEPPVGSVAAEGERFVSYMLGPFIEDLGQIVIPTGVVEVVRAPRHGDAAVAKVVRLFREVRTQQRLMAYDSTSLGSVVRPQPVVPSGRWASVKWVTNEPVLPTLQNYLVLNISDREGVKPGDIFELFRPGQPPREPGELAKPDIPIGTAQVVRVTSFASTVLITGQEQPSVKAGTMARVSAKMP